MFTDECFADFLMSLQMPFEFVLGIERLATMIAHFTLDGVMTLNVFLEHEF